MGEMNALFKSSSSDVVGGESILFCCRNTIHAQVAEPVAEQSWRGEGSTKENDTKPQQLNTACS